MRKVLGGLLAIRRGGTASMRTQQSMFAFFLLAGGPMVRTATPGTFGALMGDGLLKKRCTLRGLRKT